MFAQPIKEFVKKLQIFRVTYGKLTTLLFGIKDGGAKANQINDTTRAKINNGNTIFNINHPDNLGPCYGGHYHDISAIVGSSKICIDFEAKDWINNKIRVLATGTPTIPGEIGPHNFTSAVCLEVHIRKKISTNIYKEIKLNVQIDSTTKDVYLRKAPLGKDFTGKVLIDAYL